MTDQNSALVLAWLTGFAELNKGLPRTKYLDDSLDRSMVLVARRVLAASLRSDAPIPRVILDALANLIDPEDVQTCTNGKPTASSRQREFVIKFRSQQRRSDGLVKAAIVNAVYEDIYVSRKSRENAVASVGSRLNVSEDDAAKIWDKFRWSRNGIQNTHTERAASAPGAEELKKCRGMNLSSSFKSWVGSCVCRLFYMVDRHIRAGRLRFSHQSYPCR
jgi:hypothetical protein